jgi:hypothetical protein
MRRRIENTGFALADDCTILIAKAKTENLRPTVVAVSLAG